MDFSHALHEVGRELDRLGARWALVGGLALGCYGIVRSTVDLDLLTESWAGDELVAWLERNGWQTLHRASGYSNHLHTEPRLGRIDVVYVAVPTAEKLFALAQVRPGPGGQAVRVPSPEHLVAMKVLAIKNDPSRTFQDLADIRNLLLLPGIDRTAVAASFARHDLHDHYRQLLATLGQGTS